MEVHHKSHPIRGWREFLKEVGIIVVGVLIALAAEQGTEAVHWAHEVRDAHDGLRTEMDQANESFAFRVAAESCINLRLDTLELITERAASHQRVPHLGPVQPDISNAFVDGDWQAYRASQVLTHFKHPELENYGAYYGQVEHVRDWVAEEHGAWDVLDRLRGDPARLGAEDFARLRDALSSARTSNKYIVLIAREELRRSASLGVPGPRAGSGHLRATDIGRLHEVCAPQPISSAASTST